MRIHFFKKIIAATLLLWLCLSLSACITIVIESPATTPATSTRLPEITLSTESTTQIIDPIRPWSHMRFTLDGVTYQMPFSYRDLQANGWTFDIRDYGYDSDYALKPGEMVYFSIYLKNEAYSDMIEVCISLKNNSHQTLSIYDCDVWRFSVSIDYIDAPVTPYPEMILCNGLSFGDTAADLIAACGPCDEDMMIYSSSGKYITYDYMVDYAFGLAVRVYDAYGITMFELTNYT
jgi:hypothetical protein